ncbi:MAG: universal stress protein [Acidimicrobiales bacterium]|nr:universal stress protein [Acidimicrobiales bacterium]
MILLTLDTSSASEAAIPVGVDLARRFEQPLRLLLVIDGQLRHQFSELGRDRHATVDEVAAGYLAQVVDRIGETGATSVEVAFRHGADAATAIIAASEDPEVALVVMATHGRSGISRVLTGSVTAEVIRSSPVPVVVVPAQVRPAP